jgi:hypothetical protein
MKMAPLLVSKRDVGLKRSWTGGRGGFSERRIPSVPNERPSYARINCDRLPRDDRSLGREMFEMRDPTASYMLTRRSAEERHGCGVMVSYVLCGNSTAVITCTLAAVMYRL